MYADVANRQHKAVEQTGVILNEIPDDLKRFVAYIAKAFYGPEFYVVLHYISLSATIKEEELRIKTTFDQRFLRKILAQLKMDKIVTERCEMEETDARMHRVAYYHINYRGLINVVKYKLDHMRRRMEVKENETMSKMSYKCIGCDYTYGALDMDRIFDIATSKMKCYRCQQEVIIEESILPSQQTRSSLARFNDQMMRIFILLERLEGIRLAHHLLEPPIGPVASNLSKVENEKNVEMNERAFNGSASITHSAMQQGNITIHMEGENTSSKIEAKEVVPWLHSGTQPSLTFLTEVGNSRENVNDSMDCSARKEDVDSSSESPAVTDIEDLLMSEFKEDISSRSVVEMKKETIDCDLISEGSASENGDTIYVEGRRYHIDELTPELVLQMTAAEKEAYVRITQENFDC